MELQLAVALERQNQLLELISSPLNAYPFSSAQLSDSARHLPYPMTGAPLERKRRRSMWMGDACSSQ